MSYKRPTIEDVKQYWGKRNIPQQWYSKKQPFTLPWFNELSFKRYNVYYEYFRDELEFGYHGGEDILEIGCGLGTDLVEYAKHGAVVTGIDLGSDQVLLTKLNFSLRGLPYKEIKEGNAEDIPFPDSSFDLVLCIGVIHHTSDSQKAIMEIYRVLKSDGKAIVLIYARGWKHYIKRCLIHGLLKGRWVAHKFNWQKVYNEVSEVHGFTPKTEIYTRRQVKAMFRQFPSVELKKKRMGEFFDYKPYNTFMFPRFVGNLARLFNLGALFGENWLVKVQKVATPREASVWGILFKHY